MEELNETINRQRLLRQALAVAFASAAAAVPGESDANSPIHADFVRIGGPKTEQLHASIPQVLPNPKSAAFVNYPVDYLLVETAPPNGKPGHRTYDIPANLMPFAFYEFDLNSDDDNQSGQSFSTTDRGGHEAFQILNVKSLYIVFCTLKSNKPYGPQPAATKE